MRIVEADHSLGWSAFCFINTSLKSCFCQIPKQASPLGQAIAGFTQFMKVVIAFAERRLNCGRFDNDHE